MSKLLTRYRARPGWRSGLPLAVTTLILLLLPLAISGYGLSFATEFCETVLLLTGLNLISG